MYVHDNYFMHVLYNNFQVLGIMRCNWNEVANMTGVSVTPVGMCVCSDCSDILFSTACNNRSMYLSPTVHLSYDNFIIHLQ